MDNTRIAEPDVTQSGKWRTCTANQGRDFSTEGDAKNAAQLCSAAYEAGRTDKAREVREVLEVR
ncbi:MAG: hypothetical protein KAS66_05435 [Candidatus Omnitrophica bacterium]|nr:hypothetical protein [Candidatus Omnitrophota bacterium]